METDHPGTPFVRRPPRAEDNALREDLLSVMRALNRMRPELQRAGAWLHVEAACIDLNQARTQLMRGDSLPAPTTKEHG